MITSHKYEGKTEEENLKLCIEELKTNDIYYVTNEKEGGLFKGKKIITEVNTKEEIISSIKEYISKLSDLMNVKITSEIRINENNISIVLVSDNSNILIGKDGKTLNAIQLIIRQSFHDLNKYRLKILIDASNYKEKKAKYLEYEIKKICKEVLKTKVEVKLDPMNSFERRIVHSIVSEFENLESISQGETPNRFTIIKYKD